MRKKKYIEGIIEDSIFPNKSVVMHNEIPVIFKGGLPGQKVSVQLKRNRQNHKEGKLIEILERAPYEVISGSLEKSGGVAYDTISYDEELELKKGQLAKLYKLPKEEANITASPVKTGYRNKMEYTFGDTVKGGPLVLGLHEKDKFYSIVETENCVLSSDDFKMIRKNSQIFFRERNLSYYHRMSHQGYLRHLMVRKGESTGEILINLFTTSQGVLDEKSFVDMLLELELKGKIVGIIHTVFDGLSDTVGKDKEKILYGEAKFHDSILGLDFEISPYSFFQTNTKGAEVLYQKVLDFAGDISNSTVFDLYSGTGTIGQIFATKAKKVIGVEIVEEAVLAARENAKKNRLDNVVFHAGDVLAYIGEIKESPDIVVIDPPREGIHPKAINGIIDYEPERFVYVSCNPVTQIRDIEVFKARGYEVEKIEFMDMFPRTPHVESVVLLSRK